ncbi:MAG: hypothetical protein NTZ78_05275 [Candidatus Aureabacteria bacterium]|nr:hypothetical protein [Candidatus Auribacterota bacterium]
MEKQEYRIQNTELKITAFQGNVYLLSPEFWILIPGFRLLSSNVAAGVLILTSGS